MRYLSSLTSHEQSPAQSLRESLVLTLADAYRVLMYAGGMVESREYYS